MQRICRLALTMTAALLCMTIILGSASISKAAPPADRVEARIKDLHSKLKITQAQKVQWTNLAQVMRENASTMEPLAKARKEKGGTMNAVDDLKSYSELMAAHAAGLKNFIAAFEPLYSSMSDDQKKTADKLFAERLQKRLKKK